MSLIEERLKLQKKWADMKEYINLWAEKLPYDRVQELREEQTKYYLEWKKINTIIKLKDKIEKEKLK